MRSAPANAMMTALSCWLTWLRGITKLRDSVMNEAIMPSVTTSAPARPDVGQSGQTHGRAPPRPSST